MVLCLHAVWKHDPTLQYVLLAGQPLSVGRHEKRRANLTPLSSLSQPLAMVPAAYAGTRALAANIQQVCPSRREGFTHTDVPALTSRLCPILQRDHWSNAVIGGAAAGFLIGISRASPQSSHRLLNELEFDNPLVAQVVGSSLVSQAPSLQVEPAAGTSSPSLPFVPFSLALAPRHLLTLLFFQGTPVYKIDQNALERYKRVEAHHLQRKKWEDINPPPGKGYCIEAYPGYTKSYTDNLAPAAPY